jgi:indole-3-glycerol phosphate synthase / phosphoribosylanthranilate isomerase
LSTHILDTIVAQKRSEIKALYDQYHIAQLRQEAVATSRSFYQRMAAARAAEQPFFIFEFKRKSPSEGWIAQEADVATQVGHYAALRAGAVSVLTDTTFFGGRYEDLVAARAALGDGADAPLLLQKDFVLDPIQILLARLHGADLILLIAAILAPDELERLRAEAEALGMGVLVEVHDAEELEKVQHIDFQVLGINNRDLKTFRVALNRANVLAQSANGRAIIAESGLHDACDFAVVQRAHGFLIGTSLMQAGAGRAHPFVHDWAGIKACGIRTSALLRADTSDLVGVNFSPVSKRRIPLEVLDTVMATEGQLPSNAVAVFYQNTEQEIVETLKKYPFRRVQLYADDVSPEFVRSLRTKVVLAVRVRGQEDLHLVELFAPDVDFFILDGAAPGSGQPIGQGVIPIDFPYPFLLAGGISTSNAHMYRAYTNCFGVDVASGIETDGVVNVALIEAIRAVVQAH